MDNLHNPESWLQHLRHPAFLVKDDCIVSANIAAQQHFATVGTQVTPLLLTGQEEYSSLQNGTLYLTLQLCGTAYQCSVTAYEEGHLFQIDDASANSSLQALSLAASQLSMPLSDLTILLNKQQPLSADEQNRLNHQLFRLQRIVGNMADAADSINHTAKFESCELNGVLREILEKSAHYLSYSQIKLDYKLPSQPVNTYADAEMIRRALYNLLSNAAKFSSNQKIIQIKGSVSNNVFSLTVQNDCFTPSAAPTAHMFHRYTREVGLEDPKIGLGLGMTMIHAAAAAHGGTVLITENGSGAIKITMTIPLRSIDDGTVRSPILWPDIYGGKDQALVELADVLPADLYAK